MKTVFIKADHAVIGGKRRITFSFHNNVHIGEIDIPGPTSLGAAVITEVDTAWHTLMTPSFDTSHIPIPLRGIIDDVIFDYTHVDPKSTKPRWRFTPEVAGNAKNWRMYRR